MVVKNKLEVGKIKRQHSLLESFPTAHVDGIRSSYPHLLRKGRREPWSWTDQFR